MPHSAPNPIEWKYYTNLEIKKSIDILLHQAASIMFYCGKTVEERDQAKRQELLLLEQIYNLDPYFAERCGYSDQGR
jgi:hypothetical protein